LRYRPVEMKSERSIKVQIITAGTAAAVLVLLLGVAFSGCCRDCDNNTVYDTVVVVDEFPPTPPDGVYSVTGNRIVTIFWNPNREPDLAGYAVYYNYDGGLSYNLLTEVPADQTWYEDKNLINGETKFYAVVAYDTEGLVSELSYEDVFDTPRPEGVDLVLNDYLGQNNHLSGYRFASLTGSAQAWDDPATHIYFGTPNGEYTLFTARAGVDIQDYGYVESMDEVDWAPTNGWALLPKTALIPGHSYIVRILDVQGRYNFAKIYIAELTPDHVTMDWAYQTAPDNPELVSTGGGSTPGGGGIK